MFYNNATEDDPGTATSRRTDPDDTEAGRAAGRASDADTGRWSIRKDRAFHLLQNPRRRAVFRFLLDHPHRREFGMGDLAEIVAAWENDTTIDQLTPDQRQRVYVSLYQSHLPKLDANDVIDYDKTAGRVEPTPLLAVFAKFLDPGLQADSEEFTLETGDSPPAETTDAGSGLLPRVSVSKLFDRHSGR